jgi:carbon-monoxide dehydrogenase catalytic subunit
MLEKVRQDRARVDFTVFGVTWPTLGSKEVTDYLFRGLEEKFGGMWAFEPDPIEAAKLMIAHIDRKRKALRLDRTRERVLFDMAIRRELAAA